MSGSLCAGRRLGRVVSSVLLLFGLSMWSVTWPALAQDGFGLVDDSTFVTRSGITVTWTAPWMPRESLVANTAELGLLELDADTWHVMIADGTILQPDNARGVLLGPLRIDATALRSVDNGETASMSYWLDAVAVENEQYGVFTIARQRGESITMTMLVAPVATFAEAVTASQEGVQIDGAAVFEGVGGEGLQSALVAAGGDVAVASPAADDENVPGGLKDKDQAEGQTPEAIQGTTWSDPTFGVEIVWTDEWEAEVSGETVDVALSSADARTTIMFWIFPSRGMNMSEWHDAQHHAIDEILGAENVTVYGPIIHENHTILVADGGSIFIVMETMEVAGGDAVVMEMVMIAGVNDPSSALETYQATVRIDGNVPLDGWQEIYP